jgi:hypothetical protein
MEKSRDLDLEQPLALLLVVVHPPSVKGIYGGQGKRVWEKI